MYFFSFALFSFFGEAEKRSCITLEQVPTTQDNVMARMSVYPMGFQGAPSSAAILDRLERRSILILDGNIGAIFPAL